MIHRILIAAAVLGCLPGFGKEPMRTFADEVMTSGEVWGLVTLVGDRDGTISLDAAGVAEIESKKPMTTDGIFWIASMTKPITGTAVMMAAEEGLLSVDDPVSKYLPEFNDLKDQDGNAVVITIANCLSHTAGLMELTDEEEKTTRSLAELAPLVAKKPVKFPPGSQWTYCQTGMSVSARVVEVVSGETFPEFLQKRLFGPLGMKDTTFYPTDAQVARMARAYEKKDGQLQPVVPYFLHGKAATDPDRYPRASGGLFSTAEDYGKFARMILRGGEVGGRRYLKAETIAEMTKVRTGNLTPAFVAGTYYGLGWAVVKTPGGPTSALTTGSFGHGGAYGTQAWIDPKAGRFSILMVQRANFGNGDASDLRKAFQEAVAK